MKISILTIVFIAFVTTMFTSTTFGQFRPGGCIKLPLPKPPKKPRTKAYAEIEAMRSALGNSLSTGSNIALSTNNDISKRSTQKTYGGCIVRGSMNKHLSRNMLYGGETIGLYQLPPVVAGNPKPAGSKGPKPRPQKPRCGSHPCGMK